MSIIKILIISDEFPVSPLRSPPEGLNAPETEGEAPDEEPLFEFELPDEAPGEAPEEFELPDEAAGETDVVIGDIEVIGVEGARLTDTCGFDVKAADVRVGHEPIQLNGTPVADTDIVLFEVTITSTRNRNIIEINRNETNFNVWFIQIIYCQYINLNIFE